MIVVALDTLLGPNAKVSRAYALLLIVFMSAVTLEIVDRRHIVLNWKAVYRGEIWRLFLCFFYTGPVGIHSCWECMLLYSCMSKLEEEAYHRKTAEFIWLLCNSVFILLLANLLVSYYSSVETSMSYDFFLLMTYLWGRKNPGSRAHLLIFSIPSGYLSWIHGAVQYAMASGSTLIECFLGTLAGHVTYFLVDFIPTMPTTKGIYLLGRCPQLLERICEEVFHEDGPSQQQQRQDDINITSEGHGAIGGFQPFGIDESNDDDNQIANPRRPFLTTDE